MVFFIIFLLLIFIRLGIRKFLPWKILSISSFNLAGILLFIALGMGDNSLNAPSLVKIIIVIVFYICLLLGESASKSIKYSFNRFKRFGDYILHRSGLRYILNLVFVYFILSSIVDVFSLGRSLSEIINIDWRSNTLIERSGNLVRYTYSQKLIGVKALANMIRGQMKGFWYLSIGAIAYHKPLLTYLFLIIYSFNIFLLCAGGTRSGFAIGIMVPILLFLFSTKYKKLGIIILLITSIGIILLLNFTLLGRQGLAISTNFFESISRVLYTDFAYGGKALELATIAKQPTLEKGINYFIHLIGVLVPRVLWPSKFIIDPNWEMTEAYIRSTLYRGGTIFLFTPLGEALFYFGYIGLIIVPFLYGFTTTFLERIYSTSKCYWGLLAEVYIWSFLGMRHTYYNLFTTLVVGRLVVIILIILLTSMLKSKKRQY